MSFLIEVVAAQEAYGQDRVLVAWEYDPKAFKGLIKVVTSALKRSGIEFDWLHDRQEKDPSAQIGNDWPHVSVGSFNKFSKEDHEEVVRLAGKYKPKWKIKALDILPTRGKLFYVVADLDFPAAALEMKKALKAWGQERFVTPEDSGFTNRPHVSLVGIPAEKVEDVKKLLSSLSYDKSSIASDALQIWYKFHVVDHIAL